MNLELDVQQACHSVNEDQIPDSNKLKRWVQTVLQNITSAAQLTIRIVGEDESGKLNETYRNKRGPTNVLSFSYDVPELQQPPLLGDIVICAPLVIAEAQRQQKDIMAHWAHLVIHGVLHLLGYEHESDKQAQEMESLEKEAMKSLGFEDPYKDDE